MIDFALPAADVETSWGTISAAVLLSFLPLAFAAPLLYAAFNKANAKGYSRRAVQSVGLWLLALAFTLGAAILAVFGHYSPGAVPAYRVAAAVFGLTSWSIGVVGTAFALRGLRETDRKRKNRRRGHTYAVGGCTGNVVVLMALLGGGGWYGRHLMTGGGNAAPSAGIDAAAIFAEVTKIAAEALENEPAAPPTSHAPPPTTGGRLAPNVPPPTLVGPGGATVGRTWYGVPFGAQQGDASRDAGPATVDVPALNLQVRRPEQGWLRIDPARAGENVAVAYDRPEQKLRFLVAAERPGVERNPTSAAALDAAQRRLKKIVPSFTFAEAKPAEYGGLQGMLFSGVGTHDGEACSVRGWIAAHNGFVYQLLVAGSGTPVDAYADESQRLFGLFKPLDAELVAHAPEAAPAADGADRASLGLQIGKLPAPWTEIADLAAAYPAAEYGARYDAETGFIVVAVRLDETSVSPTAAAYALLTEAGASYEQATARSPKSVNHSNLAGEEFTWSASGKDGGLRTARVFVGRRAAYLLLGWCDTPGSPRHEALRVALDGVNFTNVAATPAADLPPAIRNRSGRFYHDAGTFLAASGLAASAELQFRAALGFAPDEARYLADLADVLLARRHYPEAVTELERRPVFTQQHDSLRLRLADALAGADRRADAISAYAELFRDGYVDDDAFRRYVDLLEQAGRRDDALTAVRAYRRRHDSAALYALEAEVLAARGDNLAAASMLKRRVEENPAEPAPALALAGIYRRQQQHDDALALIDKLIAAGGASADAYYQRGLIEYDLRRTRGARDSFEQSHRLDPADVEAKQMLDYVTRLLGEAENLRIRTPIDPVPLPKTVVDAAPTSPMPDEFGRAPAYYLDRTTAYRFAAGQDYRRTEYHTIRVLTAQGVDELNTLSVRFDPASEEVYVNRLEVFDDRGRSVASGDVSTFYLVDESAGPEAGRRTVMMPVPGLRPGYRIELVATVHSFIDRARFPFLETYFGLDYPVRRQAVVVAADPNQLAWSGTQADAVRREAQAVWWQAVDVPAIRREPFAPDPAETEPSLFVADKRSTWQSETENYVQALESLKGVEDVVVKTAQELTAGLSSTEDKLLALSAFVQREIAYRPAPFDPFGRLPQSAEQTLTNRFGNGQDVSLLLAQMLYAAAPDSPLEFWLALVNTDRPVQDKLATLDQFNHMVVLIPEGDSGRVIDATDKEADARLPVPLRLAGREALIIDPRNPRLVRLPRVGADSYRADVARRIRFDARGAALVEETITFHDYYAAAMRGRLRDVAPDDRAEYWQRMLREAGTAVVLHKLTVDKLEDLTAPLVVTAEYDVDRALTAVAVDGARQWVGAIPAAFEATLLSAPAVETRHLPLDFPVTLRVSSSVEVEPPQGMLNADEADLFGHADSDLLTVERTGRGDQGTMRLALQLRRPSGRHPPNRYEDYRKVLQQARAASAPTVRFAKPKDK